MKLGITSKVFVALLTVTTLVAIATGLSSRISFSGGFLGYLNERGLVRLESAASNLAIAFKHFDGWEFLRRDPRAWYSLLRPTKDPIAQLYSPRPSSDPDESDLTGVGLRLTLLDADGRFLAGNSSNGDYFAKRAIVVDGQTVGWVALVPFQRVTAAADVRFQERQLRAISLIAAAGLILTALATWWLSRVLLTPLRQITSATHRLMSGEYDCRIEVSSRDELGLLAQHFNRLAQKLQRNEKIRRDFMADISHELRTPLALLRAELEAIEDGVRQFTPRTIGSLQKKVTALTTLVNDLSDLCVSDAGALAYRMFEVDLVSAVSSTVESFQAGFDAKGIAVTQESQKPLILITGDEFRLHQLVSNLLENSLKYTNPGGRVKIVLDVELQWAVLEASDSEPGVPEDALDQLFDRFYRVSRADGINSGTGLGLTISRNIVEAHGGRIVARKSDLGGLSVRVYFPLSSRLIHLV